MFTWRLLFLCVICVGCRESNRVDREQTVTEKMRIKKEIPTKTSANSSAVKSPPLPKLTQSAFDEAALAGRLPLIHQGIAQGLDVNHTASQGRTPLMLAGFNGHAAVVALLLRHGAKVNQRDASGRTALMYAASATSPETVAALLSAKAEVDFQDNVEKWTALMFAASEGRTDIVRALLSSGANARLVDMDGDTALTFALKNGHREVADMLRDANQ